MIKRPDLNDVKKAIPEAPNLKYLDSGGYKFVYEDIINGKKEAIKIVYIPDNPNDQQVREENVSRIEREIEIVNNTKTESLVKLGSIKKREEKIGGETFFIYSEEYLEGENLRDLIKKTYKPDESELKMLCLSLISCIEEFSASRNEIIHRDIKPKNIIKTGDASRQFVLFDLGIAFYTSGTNLTQNPHHVPGTRENIPPEFFDPSFRDRIDYRSDLYNAGLTIYEYATQKHPFRSKSEYVTLSNIQNIKPDPLIKLRPDLDPKFCTLIDSWLKKKPMLRQRNFDAIKNILK